MKALVSGLGRSVRLFKSRGVIGLLLGGVLLSTLVGPGTDAAFAAGSKGQVLTGSLVSRAASYGPARRVGAVPRVPAGSVDLGPLAPSTPMNLVVALDPSDPQGLQSYAEAVSTPASGAYRRYLTPREFASRFGATPASVETATSALRAQGLQVGKLSPNGLSLAVSGTATRVGAAFDTDFRRYRIPGGREAFANTAAPLLQPKLSGEVEDVIGFDALDTPQPGEESASVAESAASEPEHSQTSSPNVITGGPQPCAAAANDASTNGAFTADQLASAYRFSPLYAAGDFGQGVRVALYEEGGYNSSDIAGYQSCYGTSATVDNVAVDGGDTTVLYAEATLDIETIIGLAPKATLDVYEAPPTGTSLYDGISAMVSADTDSVISLSYDACELQMTQSELAPYSAVFEEAAVQGQSVLAASGDYGNQCPNEISTNPLSVEFPADDPYVTGVGGTKLTALGPPPSEMVWNGTADGMYDIQGGSGGGISRVWPMPWYQADAPAGLKVLNANSSGANCGAGPGDYCREVPDVSADANPDTAYVVYDGGTWGALGGTSAATPLWAALIALVDSSPACAGTSVGFANPALYRAAGRSESTYFNDITTGTNDFDTRTGLYPAGTGYDMASGLGTPNAGALANALCRGPTIYVANTASNSVTPIFGGVAGTPIQVGSSPAAIAITPNGATAYVANTGSNTVTPINTVTNIAGTPIPVGTSPSGIAITPNGTTVYVANSGSNSVTPIPTATDTAGTPIVVGSAPLGVAVTPDGKFLYAANSASATVTQVAIATNEPTATITVGSTPKEIALMPNGMTAYVTNSGSDTVTPISVATNTTGTPIQVGASPDGIAVTPNGTTVYVANSGSNSVTPIPTATDTAGSPITVGQTPIGLAVTPDGSTVDVADSAGNSIVAISTETNAVGSPLTTGSSPQSIAIVPDQGPAAAFTDSSGSGMVMTFSALTSSAPGTPITSYKWNFGDGTVITTSLADASHTYAAQGSYTVALTVTDGAGTSTSQVFTGQTVSRNGEAAAATTQLVVAQPVDAFVVDLNNDSVIPKAGAGTPIPVGDAPGSIAITPNGQTAYVANLFGDSVTPIDISTGTAGTSIPVGSAPVAIAISPNGQTIYVANYGGDTVTPIATSTDTAGPPISVGSSPDGVAVTPNGQTVYVANYGGDTVTPIATSTDTAGPPISVGSSPDGVAVTPNGQTVYVANSASDSVTPIATASNSPEAAIAVGASPVSLAVSPNGQSVYVDNILGNTVTPIATATNSPGTAIPVCTEPSGVAFTPDGQLAYVACQGPDDGYTPGSVTPIITATGTPGQTISATEQSNLPELADIATVPDQAPEAAISVTPAQAGHPTQFNASASVAVGAPISSYAWNFGDNSSTVTTTPTVTHTYAAGGTFSVTLTLTDVDGTSTTQVFTGRTVSLNGAPTAAVTQKVQIPSRIAAPTITSFSPASAAPGASVTIKGTNLTGATEVTIGKKVAKITSDKAGMIKIKVPTGATTAKINVTTGGGTASSKTKLKIT
jgi:YVTN family beta-propeller protein